MDSPKDDVSYGNISDDTIVDYESLIKVIQPLLIIINSFFSHSFFFFFVITVEIHFLQLEQYNEEMKFHYYTMKIHFF